MDFNRDSTLPFFGLFNFARHSIVNFVGGGGKTLLIHVLMQECISMGHVMYTTTTRMHPPNPDRNMVILSADNLQLLKDLSARAARGSTGRNLKVVTTGKFMEPDLLAGVPCDFLESFDRSLFHLFLNEADGSARFSLKLPRHGEPVPMTGSQYLVPVIGLDCLYKAAAPDAIFRFEKLAPQFSLLRGQEISPELAARILMHPKGVCKDWKEGIKIIPYINKVDTPEMDRDARALAMHLLENENFPVSHVVWGSVRYARACALRST